MFLGMYFNKNFSSFLVRIRPFIGYMSFFGICFCIALLTLHFSFYTKDTFSSVINVPLIVYILFDLILLNRIVHSDSNLNHNNNRLQHPQRWINSFFVLLGVNFIWSLAIQHYISRLELYPFHFVYHYIVLAFALLLLWPYLSVKVKDVFLIPIKKITSKTATESEQQAEQSTSSIPYNILLVGIVVVGFVLRYLGAVYGNIDLDEGIHLYDAKLITEGFVPFRDYFSREPYYIYSLALFVKLFGAQLLTSRLFAVISSTILIVLTYLLGKKIFSQPVGLIAAALFAFSPYAIYYNYLGNLYSVYPVCMGLFFLACNRLFHKRDIKSALLAGFLLGVSVHFYRISIFYYPIVGAIWGMYPYLRHRIALFFSFWFILAIPFFLPIIYFSIQAGYTNFEIIYGTNELILAYFVIPIGYLCGYIAAWIWSRLQQKGKQVVFFMGLGVLAVFVRYSFLHIGILSSYKIKIFFDVLLQSWHIIFFIVFTVMLYIQQALQLPKKLSMTLYGIFFVLIASVGYGGIRLAQNLENFASRKIPFDIEDIFLLILLLSLSLLYVILSSFSSAPPSKKSEKIDFKPYTLFWIMLFFAPTAFYLVHVQLHVSNFMIFFPLSSIFAAFGIYRLYLYSRDKSVSLRYVAAVLFSICIFLPTYLFLTVPLTDRSWPQNARIDIEDYIIENTDPQEEIFTMANLFVLESNRRIALDLSRLSYYGDPGVEMPDYILASKNSVPSEELAEYVKKNVNLIIMDNRTQNIFANNTDLQEIKQYYYLDKQWPEYNISAWKKK